LVNLLISVVFAQPLTSEKEKEKFLGLLDEWAKKLTTGSKCTIAGIGDTVCSRPPGVAGKLQDG
jgi:hypothetical protein